MTNPAPGVPPPVIPDELDRFIFNPDQFIKDDVPARYRSTPDRRYWSA